MERRGKVLPWDLKRMTESLLAERARAEDRQRADADRQRVEAEQAAERVTVAKMTDEERERQGLVKSAIALWRRHGMKGRVPERIDELREYIEQNGAKA